MDKRPKEFIVGNSDAILRAFPQDAVSTSDVDAIKFAPGGYTNSVWVTPGISSGYEFVASLPSDSKIVETVGDLLVVRGAVAVFEAAAG